MDVHHGGVVLVNGYLYVSNWLHNVDALSGTRERKCIKNIRIARFCYISRRYAIYDEKEAMSD